MHKEQYLTYEKAQKIVQKLKIENYREYEEQYKKGKLPNLPAHPDRFWSNKKILNNYIRDYKKARRIARKLKLKRLQDYLDLGKAGKLPKGLPKRPEHYYKDFTWKDFLNTKTTVKKGYSREGKKFWDYYRAARHIQKLGIVSERGFRRAKKEGIVSLHVPKDPSEYYKRWISWEKFFGKNNRNGSYATYEECKKWARSHKIKSGREWYVKHPKNMPRHVWKVYKDKWKNMNEFLGNKNNKHIGKDFRWIHYEKLKELVQKIGIKNNEDYRKWAKQNLEILFERDIVNNIPGQPDKVYKEWKGWKEFLGTELLTFKEAREWARKSGIKNSVEWKKYPNKPANIPICPEMVYRRRK